MFDAHGVAVTADYVFVAANDPALVVLHLFTPGPTLSFARAPRLGENGFRVALEGLPGLPFQIERSADSLNWQIWTNGVLGTGPLELQDATATLNPFRVYRARGFLTSNAPWDY